MRKASRILLTVGFIMTIFLVGLFLLLTVSFFIISSPDYKVELINQLKEGKIHTTFVGTVEEQAKQIQTMFLALAIIFTISSTIYIGSMIFALLAKIKQVNLFYIISLVLSALNLNALIILGSIFGLVANHQDNNVESINATYL